jgi:hypothetical protein
LQKNIFENSEYLDNKPVLRRFESYAKLPQLASQENADRLRWNFCNENSRLLKRREILVYSA